MLCYHKFRKIILHETKYVFGTNAQPCMGYVNNYDQNRYLDFFSKVAVHVHATNDAEKNILNCCINNVSSSVCFLQK